MLTPSTLNDTRLVSDLYIEHRPWLFRWLTAKLGCDEQACDVIQNTFVRVLSKPEQLSSLHEPRAYLTTIAKGLVMDYWRRQKLEKAYLDALSQVPEATQSSEEHRAEILETLYQIHYMLEKLSEPVRLAFLWSQLEGLKYQEIATRLGVTERTVKNYMAKAMFECLKLLNQAT